MRVDKLRLVAWVFVVAGAIGAYELVKAAAHGQFYFELATLGLWIGFDLLDLQPRARVWAMRLAGVQIAFIALILLTSIISRLTSGWLAMPNSPSARQIALDIGTLVISSWQLHVLREPDVRARFASEQDRDASETGPGVRLFAAAILAAGFGIFANAMSWHLRGSVTGIDNDALPHTVVVARDVYGKIGEARLTDSSTYSFQFWRRPSSPVKIALCDARTGAPAEHRPLVYKMSGSSNVRADVGDADFLCGG